MRLGAGVAMLAVLAAGFAGRPFSPDAVRVVPRVAATASDRSPSREAGVSHAEVTKIDATADSLLHIARDHHTFGRYREAIEAFERVLEVESTRGSPHRQGALAAMRGIARAHVALQQTSVAEEFAERCAGISRELFDRDDSRRSENIAVLAEVRIAQDRLHEAGQLFDDAIALLQNAGESDSEIMADCLEWRATVADRLGSYIEALALFERALTLRTRHQGLDDPETLFSQLGIASIRRVYFGEFAQAEYSYQRLLGVAERAFGPAHPLVAGAVIGLAACFGDLGDAASAEKILRRCLEATTETYGECTGQAGRLMSQLAEILSMLGKDAEATTLYRRAASLAEDVYGPQHAETARALSGLAHTYRRIGESARAATLYKECIRIVERNHGVPHPDLVHYRCRLGMSLQEGTEGNRMSPESLESIERGISEAKAIYGECSYMVALEERHLGLALMIQRRYEEAYPVFERCLAILDEYFGGRHPYRSKALKGLSCTCFNLGRNHEALDAIDQAIFIQEAASGADRYELAFLLNQRVGMELAAERWDAALATATRAADLGLEVLRDNLCVSSDREAVLFAVRPWSSTLLLIMAAATHPALPPPVWEDVYTVVLKTNGRVLDWLVERRRFLDTKAGSLNLESSAGAWRTAMRQTADVLVAGAADAPDSYAETLMRSKTEEEDAQRALNAAVQRWRQRNGMAAFTDEISTRRVAAELEPGATLLQYVHYVAPIARSKPTDAWHEFRYGVFRLRTDETGALDLRFFDLDRAVPVDSLINEYRRCVDEAPVGRRPSARQEATYRSTARKLYDALWSPVFPTPPKRPGETGAPTDTDPIVLIVPDSGLNVLDFSTLLDENHEPVIEHWKVHLLSSGRSVLRVPDHPPGEEGLLAVGDPLIGRPAEDGKDAPREKKRGTNTVLCDEAIQNAGPLPGARDEVLGVVRLFSEATGRPATALLGEDATEHAVKRTAPGKRIIHLATHGWFCNPFGYSTGWVQESPFDPLLASGLILAPGPDGEDGFLTAAEVACLQLEGVDWVVLSACGSGLGRTIWGEGVFGLRRAFEIAGARSVIVTLWRMDDAVTQDLMRRIYRHRLSGQSTVDSIRLAQLERLRETRRRFNRLHPALWAGIIAQGDWR